MNLVPQYAFFVAGTGTHLNRLHAFENALLNAGPIAHNLVAVSSILPAGCKIITPGEGFAMLKLGAITFCVMAREDTDVPDRWASASVGVVKPKDPNRAGYLSEYHGHASSREDAARTAQWLAREMFEVKFGCKIADLELENIEAAAASIRHPGGDVWVSAVALCMLVLCARD
ncbi:arginine decarboxylase, pyruvoyl-dependent [Candidatus Kaiserbacteria bacterium]|nr:arginine decarboxylase, pyruvoyl-dependent [Candidatus Kaiserbacteria bacterium]